MVQWWVSNDLSGQVESLVIVGGPCLPWLSARRQCGLRSSHAQEQATTETTRYTIEDLGVVATNPSQPAQPILLTNNGLVVGSADVGKALHAVLWHGGTMIDIGHPGLGGNSYLAKPTND